MDVLARGVSDSTFASSPVSVSSLVLLAAGVALLFIAFRFLDLIDDSPYSLWSSD